MPPNTSTSRPVIGSLRDDRAAQPSSLSRRTVLVTAPIAYGTGAFLQSTAATVLFSESALTLLWGCMIVLVCVLVSLVASTATAAQGWLSRHLSDSLPPAVSVRSAGTVLTPLFFAGVVLSGLA